MTPPPKRTAAYISIIVFTFIVICTCIIYLLRPTSGDHIDNNTTTLISNYLSQSIDCDIIEEKNEISPFEMRKLKHLDKYDVLAYSDMKEVEQEINCLSDPMSKLLYTGWLIKQSEHSNKARVDIEIIIKKLLRTSIILSVDESSYIPEETLRTLQQIDFFKQPFKLERASLEENP